MNSDSDTMGISRRTVLTTTAGVTAAGLAGCLGDDNDGAGEQSHEEDNHRITAGMPALWDFTRQIAGDHMEAIDLVPTGQHGHDYEPGPGIVQEIEDADGFVYMRDFAGWQDDAAAELENNDDVAVIDASEGIEFFDSPAEDNDEHWWMDPVECQNGVENIANGLAEIDPDHADDYEANAAGFNDELQALHEDFESLIDRAERDRIVIGTHDSFQWWNRRYGLTINSPIGTSPDGEASARDIEEIEQIIEEHGIQHILYDIGEPTHLADSLAEETAAEILPLSPVETQLDEHPQVENISAEWGYVDHMREINLPSLEIALDAS